MATIKEVAQRAGVSVGTVSNILAGLPSVAGQLRERVQRAMAELQYEPSHVARSLKSKKTRTLAMVISDITNPFFPLLVRGAEDEAARQGYMLAIFNTDDDLEREQQICRSLTARGLDGLLLVPSLERGDNGHLERLQARGMRVVCLDRKPEGVDVDAVLVDNAGGVAKGIGHLAEQGARRIGYLGGDLKLHISAERKEGYERGMAAAGLAVDPDLVWEADFRLESAWRVAREVLAGPRPDAVFVANLPMALGWMRAMGEKGLAAPRDLLLATFDHLVILDSFRPRLTAVVQPSYEIGRQGVKLLLERIAKPERETQLVRLATELRIGETSVRGV
jgi:LacI family transcriptional regulator